MRAVVGGTVTAIEPWNYVNKTTGEQVNMQSVFFLAGRTVDKVAVPLALGAPSVGEEVFYVADVNLSTRKSRDGSREFTDLSVWARGIYEYDGDPFVLTPANAAPKPAPVKAVAN